MPSYNRVMLMGNCTRDPQLKYLPNQTAVCDFGIASNRKFKGSGGEEREEVLFIDCVAFGKIAEVINEHFKKGKPIFLDGRLKYDTWDDKNGGGKRHKISVVVDTFQFIGAKESGDAPRVPSVREKVAAKPAPSDPFADGGGPGIPDDDIPFSACKV